MTPVCAITVCTDCGVRYVPLIGGMLTTSPVSDIPLFHFYINNSNNYPSLLFITLGIIKESSPHTYCT